MNRDELVEKCAKAMFGLEHCDRQQMLELDRNWQDRLSEKDQEDYRELARAVLPLIEADLRERIATEAGAIRCATACSQHPNCQHDWRAWHTPRMNQSEKDSLVHTLMTGTPEQVFAEVEKFAARIARGTDQ